MLEKYKAQIAVTFRRFPILGVIGTRIWRLGQARYSLGAVGVVLNDDGQILLLKHVFHPTHPWGLPGGWVDRNERPSDTVIREIREETGLRVEVLAPLIVDFGVYAGHLDLAYLCRLDGGHVSLNSEILAYRWADPNDLPSLFEFQNRAIKKALRLQEALQ